MNLKLARIRSGIKQKDFAKMLNVAPATLINWEKDQGQDKITLGKMKLAAKILNSTVEELFLSEN